MSRPEFLVWAVLVAAQSAIWVLSLLIFVVTVWALPRGFRLIKRRAVWGPVVLFALALAVPVLTTRFYSGLQYDSPLYAHKWRGNILVLFGSSVALVGAFALAAISAVAGTASGSAAERLDAYISRRDELQRVLFFLGTMIGAATLALGASRHALIVQGGVTSKDFPPELVLAYGAYYSFFLVAAYVPVYLNVLALGREVVDDLLGKLPAKLGEGKAWAEWISQREAADLLLQLRTTPVQRLRTALAILAPLAGSAVSLVLGID